MNFEHQQQRNTKSAANMWLGESPRRIALAVK